jgi:hypothetical protein
MARGTKFGRKPDDLQEAVEAVESATEKLTEFDAVEELEDSIGELFADMSGPRQDVKPRDCGVKDLSCRY